MESTRTRNGVTVGGTCEWPGCGNDYNVVNGLCEDCAVALDPGPA